MPATHVSPALRRRISDDARQLLQAALSEGCEDFGDHPLEARTCTVNHLAVTERLQNFRGQLRLELLDGGEVASDTAVPLRITVTSSAYLLRYQVASTGAEVSVLNRAGVATSWITTAEGNDLQLGRFLSSTTSSDDDELEAVMQEMDSEILALLGVLDSLDLLDMVRALETATSGIYFGGERIYHATGEKSTYVFDARTGYPLSITQAPTDTTPEDASSCARVALQLSIDDYVRHDDSSIAAPIGIKSDVELLVDTAVECFYDWTASGRQQLEQLFALLDQDDDGSVSGQDVVKQLLDAGYPVERADAIAMEMARLLCNSDDPSEEVTFLPFVGFWIMLLADDVRVSDPSNESRVVPALQQLFLA